MMNNTRILAPLALAVLLAACGGGGSDAPVTPTAPAAAATPQAVQLTSAMANIVNQSRTSGLTVVGTASAPGQSVNFTGSGTYSETTTAATFEGVAGFRKTITVNGTLVGTSNGQTASSSLNTVSEAFFDSNYKPVGATGTGSYCVTTSSTALPATAQAGAQGNWYSQDCYSSSAKTSKLGTVSAKYVVEADSATSLLLKVTTTTSATNGTVVPGTSAYRITSAGGVTRVSDSTTATVNGVTVNLTITYQ